MPRKTLTLKAIEGMTSEGMTAILPSQIRGMTREEKGKVAREFDKKGITRISHEVRLELAKGEILWPEVLMSSSSDRHLPSSTYVSAQELGEEDPCIPSCGPYE